MSLDMSLRRHAERTLIEFARVCFMEEKEIFWREHPEDTKVIITSDASRDNLEFIRQIRLTVGDLSEFKGAIDHLREWSAVLTKRLYVDQMYLQYSCYAEEPDEAMDMANFLRRCIRAARTDFNKRGIFGLSNVGISKPQPNQVNYLKDSLYVATVQGAFMVASSDTVSQAVDGETLAEMSFKFDDRADMDCDPDTEGIQLCAPPSDGPTRCPDLLAANIKSIKLNHRGFIEVTFTQNIEPAQISGLNITYKGTTKPAVAVRDFCHLDVAIIEPDEKLRGPAQISYTPGDLKLADGTVLAAFGPYSV